MPKNSRMTLARSLLPEAGQCADVRRKARVVVLLLSVALPLSAAGASDRPAPPPRDLDCLIEPHLQIKLSNPVEGVLKSVEVDRGDVVRRGQVLARLESEVEQAAVDLARVRSVNDHPLKSSKARVDFLKNKYRRSEKLNATKYVTDAVMEEVEADLMVAVQDFLEAELNLKLAKLELSRAEALLRQRTVTSPIDGVVVERLLAPGEYRNEQSHILTLAQIDPVDIKVIVPLELHGSIAVGDFALVRPEAPVDGIYKAKVTVLDKVFDAASGTFGVRLELPNPDYILPAGIRCRITFNPSPDTLNAAASAPGQ